MTLSPVSLTLGLLTAATAWQGRATVVIPDADADEEARRPVSACAPLATVPVIPMPRGVSAAPSVDVLIRFAILPSGRVDSSSLEMYPAVNAVLRQAAVATMTEWRTTTSDQTTMACTRLRFADTTGGRSADGRLSGPIGDWMPREDGWVERRGGWFYDKRGSREFPRWTGLARASYQDMLRNSRGTDRFTGTDLLAWVDRVEHLRDSARTVPPTSLPQARFNDARTYRPAAGSPWLSFLGARPGTEFLATVVRATDKRADWWLDHPTFELVVSACSGPAYKPSFDDSVLVRLLHEARQAARMAIDQHPRPIVDTSRLYSRLEVDCPAEQRPAVGVFGEDDAIRHALNLSQEAFVNFVIDRDGRVDPSSIHLFGTWSAADRQRVADAVRPLTFTPATVAGRRVRQFDHIRIPPREDASQETARGYCRSIGTFAVAVAVLPPGPAAPLPLLHEVVDEVFSVVEPLIRAGPYQGRFRFVVTSEGEVAFLQWVEPTSDTVGVRRWLWDPGSTVEVRSGEMRAYRIVWPIRYNLSFRELTTPLPLEVTLRPGDCP